MKSTELRIGNLVNYKYYNPNPSNPDWAYESVELIGVLKDTFYFKTRGSKKCHKVGELHPIPLTEEWLIKFGLKKDRNGYALSDIMSLSIHISKEFGFVPCYSDLVLTIKYDLKYVHQLQNLYFALTNEELTITQ